jgi:long-chain acyl-CoA synthetase
MANGAKQRISLGQVVARLAKQLERVLADTDLSTSQYRLLSWLAQGPTGASLLAGNMAISRPSVTGLVDGLVARGLVERHEDADDRRRIALAITSEGLGLVQTAETLLDERFRTILGHAVKDDAALAIRGLEVWSDCLDEDLAQRRKTA